MDFFEFLSTEFAVCSKPPNGNNYRKASYPRTKQHDQVEVELTSYDQSRRKKRRLYPLYDLTRNPAGIQQFKSKPALPFRSQYILYNFNSYRIFIFEVALAKIHGRELLLVKSSCHLPIRLSYTMEASHRLSVLTAERQVGKLWITFCKKIFGVTWPGIEPLSTVLVEDALSTRPLVGDRWSPDH